MLDGTGKDRIYAAKLISVADPLLTALYMSTFLTLPADADPAAVNGRCPDALGQRIGRSTRWQVSAAPPTGQLAAGSC